MQDLLARCRQQLPEAVLLLERMVSMESPSLDKALTDKFVQFVSEQFTGGDVTIIPAEKFGNHLRLKFPGASRNRVLLLGHTDTVWPAGELARRPFKIEGGQALGPGVFDMKSGIVLMRMALAVLKDSPVTILLTSDEEAGSPSSRALIESEAIQCAAVLVLEPALPGGALKTARKGSGRFTLKAIGRAAHAGIDPQKGVNAIEELSHQILKLQKMTDIRCGTTVTVGVVQGGTRSNVVPAEAAAEIDVRVTSMEEAERLVAAIRSLTPHLPEARLEIHGAMNRPPMERTTDTAKLFNLARTLAAQIGIDLKEDSTGGASDGNFTAALGIPTLDGLGAIGGGAHAADEWVEIESLPARAAIVAGLIGELM
ncbi:MAG TPA: M20 family metallopeptidase [Terriglobia bacterium]|jgi:glutamate carboxypeptidase